MGILRREAQCDGGSRGFAKLFSLRCGLFADLGSRASITETILDRVSPVHKDLYFLKALVGPESRAEALSPPFSAHSAQEARRPVEEIALETSGGEGQSAGQLHDAGRRCP